MENQATSRKWSELYKLNVIDPGEGKIIGQVENFFVKESSFSIYALQVGTRVRGDFTLPFTGVKAVEKDHVSVINAQKLLKAQPPFLDGLNLLEHKVVGENGTEVGPVADAVFALEPLVATRLNALEVSTKRGQRGFSVEAIVRIEEKRIIIDEKLARKLS